MIELILNTTHPYSSIYEFHINWMGYVVSDRSQLAEPITLEWSFMICKNQTVNRINAMFTKHLPINALMESINALMDSINALMDSINALMESSNHTIKDHD